MIRKLKIVFALRTDIRLGAGTEKVAYFYMKYIDREIWDPYILMTDYISKVRLSLPLEDSLFKDRIIVIPSYETKFSFIRNIPRLGSNLYEFLQYFVSYFSKFKARKIIDKFGPFDVVYIIYFRSVFYFHEHRALYVGSEHTIGAVYYKDSLRSLLTYAIHRVIFRKLDVLHRLTPQRMKDTYAGIPTFLVKNGYDQHIFYPRDLDEQEKITFLFVARLVPGKGLRTLLKSWKKARDTAGFNAELHIVGSGELAYLLENNTDTSIKYHGTLSEEELASTFGKSDFFIYPSEKDMLPLVVIEALGSGCHVITVDFFRGSFDEESNLGYLEYLKRDPEIIGKRITEVASESNKFRGMRREQAKYISDKYSWENVVKELSDKLMEKYKEKFGNIS